jgi:hypothetical protein
MIDTSYSDLTLNNAGMVYFKARALRPCLYVGQNLFALGDADNVSFFDAETIISGLHGNANLFDMPLPVSVAVPALFEFEEQEQQFLREFALGAERAYLNTIVPQETIEPLLNKAASLGLVVQKPSLVRTLEAGIREKTMAVNRARLLADKAADLSKDFIVRPAADENTPPPLGVVRRINPETYERLSRNAGGYTPAATRVRWPFNTMRIGDEIFIDAKLARRAQTAAHVYAARTGKTFRTSMNRVTKVLHVFRVEDRPE